MIRPRRMKFIELTVLKGDVNAVIEYLGLREVIHFPESSAGAVANAVAGTDAAGGGEAAA